MKLNIMSIIIMAAALFVGNWLSTIVNSMFGLGGGIIGVLIVGLLVYAVYSLLKGQKIGMMKGVTFAAIFFVAQLIAGFIAGMFGLGGGILGLFVTAIVLSFLWSKFGGGK